MLDALPSAASLGLARLVHETEVSSTMDLAHALAADGADAGTLVVADEQQRGRGRGGHRWASALGSGLWMTLIERPRDQRVVGVLALRLGLALAESLTPLVDQPLMLKWPNDVFAGQGKLAGILVEARWRESSIDWVAIGIGINRRVPADFPMASSVRGHVSRADLLTVVIPAIRRAAALTGELTESERAQWHARDVAFGQELCEPRKGIARGVASNGALLVESTAGAPYESVHAGSLRFAVAGRPCDEITA